MTPTDRPYIDRDQYASEFQRIRDDEHIRLLEIAYYVMGGLVAAVSCFFIIYLILGLSMAANPQMFATPPPAHGQPAVPGFPPDFGYLFATVGGLMMGLGWALAILLFIAARNIRRYTGYTFIQIVAGLQCLNVPFGVILGVLTFVVLSRPSIKERFGIPTPPSYSPPPPAGRI